MFYVFVMMKALSHLSIKFISVNKEHQWSQPVLSFVIFWSQITDITDIRVYSNYLITLQKAILWPSIPSYCLAKTKWSNVVFCEEITMLLLQLYMWFDQLQMETYCGFHVLPVQTNFRRYFCNISLNQAQTYLDHWKVLDELWCQITFKSDNG